jgi:enoyl-CoA hydratase/carnithine racemase
LVVAADTAYFALPEVKRGVSPIGGALPRIIRTLGLQRASEFALTGRNVTAQEMYNWGLVNKIVPQDQVVAEAVKYATMIAENSPDAIICTRAGLREGWESASVERAVEITLEREFAQLQKGENILEGEQISYYPEGVNIKLIACRPKSIYGEEEATMEGI